MLTCGFSSGGPLLCDNDPLAAETFVKPSSGLSRKQCTGNCILDAERRWTEHNDQPRLELHEGGSRQKALVTRDLELQA